jgi:hypothetical protein
VAKEQSFSEASESSWGRKDGQGRIRFPALLRNWKPTGIQCTTAGSAGHSSVWSSVTVQSAARPIQSAQTTPTPTASLQSDSTSESEFVQSRPAVNSTRVQSRLFIKKQSRLSRGCFGHWRSPKRSQLPASTTLRRLPVR